MTIYNDAVSEYVNATFVREDESLARIRAQIPERGLPAIMIRPEEAAFLQVLVAASRARTAVEIGTLGGYSGTWIARALPEDGRLITLEVNPKHAEVARQHFQLAGVAGKVDLRVGDAHALLRSLEPEGPFDFVFIDAEKEGYEDYLAWTLDNLRPGGVVAAHNAFRSGRVADPENREAGVDVMRAFNRAFANSSRLLATVYPAGDGMAIGVLRS